MSEGSGVSVVVPVRGGGATLPRVLEGILPQGRQRPFEVIVVVDDPEDAESREALGRFEHPALRSVPGRGKGAAAALNLGLREARYPLLAQLDQDVIPGPGWLDLLVATVLRPGVGAAQGSFATGPGAGFWARSMGLDVELRHSRIPGARTDHVCTGNTLYRRRALEGVGGVDETLGYGYDNDLSYRLAEAGWGLRFCRQARSVHVWRETLRGYLVQQYGLGYGRLDLVTKHPRRIGGDDVSGILMMLHAPLAAAAAGLLAAAPIGAALGISPAAIAAPGIGLLGFLGVERLAAGVTAAVRFRDPAALGFPLAHLLRDGAWAAALGIWGLRRLFRRPGSPRHSMG